jgi:hypothetical protein
MSRAPADADVTGLRRVVGLLQTVIVTSTLRQRWLS